VFHGVKMVGLEKDIQLIASYYCEFIGYASDQEIKAIFVCLRGL